MNARSLKNRDLIQYKTIGRENNDIFAVSESWLNTTVSNAEVEVDGYKLSRLDRLKKVGGEVCVYTRAFLRFKVLKDLTGISTSGFCQSRSPVTSFTNDFYGYVQYRPRLS